MMKTAELKLTQNWDKTFEKSDKVDYCKVTFVNRYGITLAADMYVPKDAYKAMTEDSKYTDNKELMIIPDAVHTDLYDNLDVIPFDKIEDFIRDNIN